MLCVVGMGRIFDLFSNIQTFSPYAIQNSGNLQIYKRISLEYFSSCPLLQNWSLAIFNFLI